MTAGTSRLVRVVGSEDLVSAGLTPTASFSPGPVTVNYILVGTARDLTISITVPPEAAPGPQTLEITDGILTHTVADALRIVDGTIPNPSPSLLSLGGSAILSIASHALFSGQSLFSLDLGPDVSVGPITVQPDGTLQAPVSVLASAIPGTRSVHLTAGPYAFLAERGFGIDFGPLVNTVHLTPGTIYAPTMDLNLPAGYTASVFAVPDGANGLDWPDEMCVDEKNTLYVLNHGPVPGPSPFSVSVFDLNPASFGAVKGVLKNLDTSGKGGLLESGTMLPTRPGKLFMATGDFADAGFPGGRTIYEVDPATGDSTLFWFYPDWNPSAIETDPTGNLLVSHFAAGSTVQGEVSLMDADGNLLKTCPLNVWPGLMRLDPLSGKLIINRPVGVGGSQTLDLADCTTVPRSDGLQFDDGSFAPSGGHFGNQFFTEYQTDLGSDTLVTLMPVASTDPEQSVPARAVPFATGFHIAESVWFDRDGHHMLVTDGNANAVIAISRILGYQPDVPSLILSRTNLTFGDLQVGTTSPAQTVTLSNTGAAILTIASIAASGDFGQSNDCGNALAAGESCTISVTFTPTAPFARTGTIAITDSAAVGPHAVSLTGGGIGPAVTLSPTALNFGSQPLGTTSAPQTVTLTNTGNALLTLDGVAIIGGFAQSNTCGTTLGPGASCAFAVTFTPTTRGSRNGALEVTDDAPGSPHVVTLIGTTTVPVAAVWGRDTWMVGGTSHILRVVGNEDLVSPGLTPTASFSPGPVTVNYILVGTARDLTISVTVPAEAAPGLQTLEITDGILTHAVADAVRIVDATILNPSPSVLSLGGSAILSIAPHPLFSGQSAFSLDLGSDLSVGPIALQPDGTLQVPVSVLASAIPGTRSLHLTAGPYTFLGERGFGVDFGPPADAVHLITSATQPPYMDIKVPQGYTASVFAKPTPETGLAGPDGTYVDEKNTLYVLNHGPSPGSPFSISAFDLNPGNFGVLKSVFRNIDPSGRGGLLESATMLPSRPGKLLYSTEDFTGQWPGGRTINELDTATGASRLFWYNPDWNFDPLETDVTGNLVGCHTIRDTGYQGNVSVLDPNANALKTCPVDVWSDVLRLDPLTGKFLISRPLGVGGMQTIDVTDCTKVLRSDGPQLDDGGGFGPAAGDFGNQLFIAEEGMSSIFTLVPVAYTDPDQSVPERAVLFATGFRIVDQVSFDRDAQHMLATDSNVSYVFSITRIASYAPPLPVVSLWPTSLTYGVQDVGTSSPAQTVTLSNTGSVTLTIASIAASQDYTQSNTCGNELAPNASCTISVSFTPIGPNIRSGYLAITDNASARPHTIPLTGTAIGPGVTFSPGMLDFGDQRVGTTSSPRTVTLSSSGNTPLIISDVVATGDYSQASACVGTMAPGDSCTITVTFTPTATGPRTGTVAVSDNAWGSPQTVALSGTGTLPAVTLSTTFLRFIDQSLGTTSGPQTLTLTNSGTAPLAITDISPSGDYAQTNTCISPVAAGANCTISVTFTPAAPGGQSGTLTISDDAPGTPHTVALSGIGLGPVASLSGPSVNFTDRPLGATSGPRAVILGNSGNAPLNITSISVSGDYAQTNNCLSPLAPRTYCTISVTFTPTVVGGTSGMLNITDDASGSPHTVELGGVGLGPVATLSSPSLLFVDQPLGTTSAPQVVMLGNSGNVLMTISSIAASGNYEQTNDCVSPLAVEAYCTISVTFTPAAVGAVSGTLSITDNASGSPRTVALNGVGLGAVASLSVATLSFANQALGTTSAPQTLTLGNSGNAPLTISNIAATGDYAQTNNCVSPLAAGTYCTVSITFTPTVVGGVSGLLSVDDDASGSPHTAALNGIGLGPVATFSPATLRFVGQPVGTTSGPQNTYFGNSGNTPLTISSILVTGDYAQTNDCLAPLAPEAYCTISVTFTPTAVGDATGTVTIANDAAGSPHRVALNGIGLGPLVTLSPSSLSFAGQLVGTTSPAQVITLSNGGNAPLTISTITASGDYAQTPDCGGSIAAGANCTVAVTFAPTTAGIRDGAITIRDDAAGSPRTISLSGTGQDFSMSSSVAVRTISAGSAAAYILFVTPLGGLHTNVSLTCTGVPSAAACRISPASLTLDGTGPVQTTVTITTTARSSFSPMTSPPRNPLGAGPWTRHALPMQLVGVLALAILASLALGRRRQIWLGLGLTLLLASLWVACGGGGERVVRGTPPGTYTLTVTTSSAGLTHNIKLTLIVN